MKVEPRKPIKADDINAIPRDTLIGVMPSPTVPVYRTGEQIMMHTRGGKTTRSSHTEIKGIVFEEGADFPPVPTASGKFFYHTGDKQVWLAYKGQDRWYPLQKATLLDGKPMGVADEDFDNEPGQDIPEE